MEKAGKLLALTLFAVIMISFLSGVVAAQGMADTFKNFFTETGWTWAEGTVSTNVAKIFFFLIVALVIMLVIGGIFKNNWISTVLSFLIAFLATAYITPAEVYSILISYTALGLTLTTMVPLAILAGFTYRAATATEGKVSLIMLQWFAWALFAIYSLYRFASDWWGPKEGSGWMNLILLVTAFVAAGMFIFNKKVMGMLAARFTEEEIAEFRREQARTRAVEKERAEAARAK